MSTLINTSSGNINNLIWNVIDDKYIGASNSVAVQIPLGTTNYYQSTTFSGGVTISHIGLKLYSTNITSNTNFGFTGSLIVGLSTNTQSSITASVAGSTVSYDLTYLPFYPNYGNTLLEYGYGQNGVSGYNCWLIFKLPNAISLTQSSYNLILNTSNTSLGNRITLYTTQIAGTPSIASLIVKSATSSRAIGDDVMITGEYYGTASYNSYNIMMNATLSTATFSSITINPNGNLIFVTSSAYNPFLSLTGNLNLYGGNLNIGTTTSPIPTNSIAKIQFNGTFSFPIGAAAYSGDTICGGIYLRPGGTLVAYSPTISSYSTTIGISASINSATLSLSSVMNWNNNDLIVIAPTEAYSQTESFTISNFNGLTVSISGTLSYSHLIIGGYKPNIVNLTRNIQIYSNLNNYPSFILPYCSGVINLNHVELYNMGVYPEGTYSTGRNGIYINATNASSVAIKYDWNYITLENCSFRNMVSVSSYDFNLNVAAKMANVKMNNNILYNCGVSWYGYNTTGGYQSILCDSSTTTIITSSNINITNNIYIKNVGFTLSGAILPGEIILGIQDINFTGNVISGYFQNRSYAGAQITGSILSMGPVGNASGINFIKDWLGDFNNNTFYANSGQSIIYLPINNYDSTSKKLSNINIWRNSGSITILDIYGKNLTLENWNFFNNGTTYVANFPIHNILFLNCTFSNSPAGSYTGLTVDAAERVNIKYENCYFSGHNTGDIYFKSTAATLDQGFPLAQSAKILLNNTSLLSTNSFTGSILSQNSYVKASRLNGATTSFKSWYAGGFITLDNTATMSKSGGTSVRATPNTFMYVNNTKLTYVSATISGIYLQASRKSIPVFSNTYLSINTFIRKSTTSDGTNANYNGLQPRLIIGLNTLVGINSDTILATCSAVNGQYELLSATSSLFINDGVVDVWVDCNGSQGWINVDDWNINSI